MDRSADRLVEVTAIEEELTVLNKTLHQVYLATPLTGLALPARRQIDSDVGIVEKAISEATELDRISTETWLLNLYVPFRMTPPWGGDPLSPTEVYRRNLAAVHASDAMIVLAEDGGSAGVGQELEWATRLGLPVAYLTASDVSRQIAGIPGFVSAQTYNGDAATLTDHVKHFLRHWKPMILDGPRRRRSRRIRYTPITLRLRAAWQNCPNRTDLAAQIRVNFQYVELALSDPCYVASMATETLTELAHHLRVPLADLNRPPSLVVPAPMLRALAAAAAEAGWDDATFERLAVEGRARLAEGSAIDLATMSGWRRLHAEVFGAT